MKYKIVYDEDKDIITGHIYGKFDTDLVKKMASEFAQMVQQYSCHRLLNDLRDAEMFAPMLDIYDMPRIADKSGVPTSCKRALVVRHSSPDFKFLERTAKNIGHDVKVFTDMDSAINWLKGITD